MSTLKNRKSEYKYKKNNIKRVPLDMQMRDYEKLAAAAAAAGIAVNTFVKNAVFEKIEKEEPD